MISCRLIGRLGNNLFQIANGLSLASKLNTELILPTITHAGHRGTIPVDISMFDYKFKQVENIEQDSVYNEPDIHYNKIDISDNTLVSGYFGSWKYFEDIKQELLSKYFTPSNNIREELLKYNILENSLGISIRRGDFLMLQDNHCVLSIEYYQEVLNTYFQNNISSIYIFSDDIEWCKTVFGDSVYYVNESVGTQLFLMSKMKHLILSNSTFAWWGAYLNQNNGIIVAPDPWLGPNHDDKNISDLYYPSWKIHKHERVFQSYTMSYNFFN
jgi:hypothetical protein